MSKRLHCQDTSWYGVSSLQNATAVCNRYCIIGLICLCKPSAYTYNFPIHICRTHTGGTDCCRKWDVQGILLTSPAVDAERNWLLIILERIQAIAYRLCPNARIVPSPPFDQCTDVPELVRSQCCLCLSGHVFAKPAETVPGTVEWPCSWYVMSLPHSTTYFLPCPALPCPALPCPALPCPALPCPALPCPALPCPALPCPALPCPAQPSPAQPCPALPCPALSCHALPCPVLYTM